MNLTLECAVVGELEDNFWELILSRYPMASESELRSLELCAIAPNH